MWKRTCFSTGGRGVVCGGVCGKVCGGGGGGGEGCGGGPGEGGGGVETDLFFHGGVWKRTCFSTGGCGNGLVFPRGDLFFHGGVFLASTKSCHHTRSLQGMPAMSAGDGLSGGMGSGATRKFSIGVLPHIPMDGDQTN